MPLSNTRPRIHFEVSGSKDLPVVLFLHGLQASCAYFEASLPLFEDEFQCVRLDMRGHGLSEQVVEPSSVEILAQDALSVLDELGVQQCAVVGFSAGGAVAQQLSIVAPARVAALVLLGTSSRVSRAAAAVYEGAATDLEAKGQPAMAAVQRAMGKYNFDQQLPQLRMPALVVGGGADKLCPVKACEILRTLLPQADLRVVDGAGHNFWREEAAVAPAVKEWLLAKGWGRSPSRL